MATGGTIPSNRTQYVSFYNTSGVVEKDKNIYYVPRFSKTGALTGQSVKTAYLNAFQVVCPPSSSYKDIPVSSWSPQDRTLVVRANIDDFRAVTDEGACLNYFIVFRQIIKQIEGITSIQFLYYGFFITDVKQAGGGSVTITAIPDDFTNVFYLHNNKILSATDISGDYEPFNEKMANNYVARQHYDRLEYLTSYNSSYYSSVESGTAGFFVVGNIYNIKSADETINYGNFRCIYSEVIIGSGFAEIKFEKTGDEVVIPVEFNTLHITNLDSQISKNIELDSWEKDKNYYATKNMKIFMNQEDSFKFKYQYRDYKYPVSPYDGIFNETERELIDDAEDIEDLPQALADKVVSTCIQYLVVETKSPEACLLYVEKEGLSTNITRKIKAGEYFDKGINRPNPIICYPFISSPEVFKKFNIESKVRFNMMCNGQEGGAVLNNLIHDVLLFLNMNGMSEYVHSAYICQNIKLSRERFAISYDLIDSENIINIYFYLHHPVVSDSTTVIFEREDTYYIGGIRSNMTNTDYNNWIYKDGNTYHYYVPVGIIVSNPPEFEYNIKLNAVGYVDNIRNSFYDPVLESEPYSFYSISTHANYELVFNKNRWYESEEVSLKYYYAVNGALKEGFIPQYIVEGIKTPYFNEGLVFTIASSLPLVSDSYYQFYNQNKAQMKNQYAVAEKNINYDFRQKIYNDTPSSVLSAGVRRGQAGLISESANQLAGLIDMTIDYAQNLEVISMNQKAKLADVGNTPDTLKQAGSDVIFDVSTDENFLFLNHYRIDELSYNSIAKLLERVGYQVNLYDSIHAIDRVGWNYVQLISFDWKSEVDIMVSQEETIRQIFLNGVTLLHDKTYLTTGHNYEISLE